MIATTAGSGHHLRVQISRWALVLPWLCVACATVPSPAAASSPAKEQADVASPRRIEQPWMSLAEWQRRFDAQLNDPHRAAARIVFVGDSITEGWCHSEAFKKAFAGTQTLNLGLSGDQTQHILWRLDHGALTGLEPRWVVLMAGVNNLAGGFSPSETADGVVQIVRRIRAAFPNAQIALLGVLPAGEKPDDPLRPKIAATNRRLEALRSSLRVSFLGLEHEFLNPDGTLPKERMPDFLHPSELGYERMTIQVRNLIEAETSPGATKGGP